jgi:hypothetical protein
VKWLLVLALPTIYLGALFYNLCRNERSALGVAIIFWFFVGPVFLIAELLVVLALLAG